MEGNKDQTTRDALMQPYCSTGKYPTDLSKPYDIASFEGLPLKVLKQLLKLRFADPDETQNDSPSILEFVEYLKANKDATVHGYIVSMDRPDYRVSIEGLHQPSGDKKSIVNFVEFNRGADELDISGVLRSWWD